MGQSCRGDGTCASEGNRKPKAKRAGETSVCFWARVEVWGTSFDWTHSCFDIDGPGRGEEDQLPQRTSGWGSRGGGELPEAALCFDAGTRKG